MPDIGGIVLTLARFYVWLIIAYVILSWFPGTGVFGEVRRVLATLVEPYLGLFRRIIPPMGTLDISPIVAILVLQVAASQLSRIL